MTGLYKRGWEESRKFEASLLLNTQTSLMWGDKATCTIVIFNSIFDLVINLHIIRLGFVTVLCQIPYIELPSLRRHSFGSCPKSTIFACAPFLAQWSRGVIEMWQRPLEMKLFTVLLPRYLDRILWLLEHCFESSAIITSLQFVIVTYYNRLTLSISDFDFSIMHLNI